MLINMPHSKFKIYYDKGVVKVFRGDEDCTEQVGNNALRDLCMYVEELLDKPTNNVVTVENVIKALSEYYGEEVYFSEKEKVTHLVSNYFYKKHDIVIAWQGENGITIRTGLPPHLIKMLGEFYENIGN